jgi:ribose transport system substrate-binding protein
VQSEHTPLRVFDKTNVSRAGTPPKDSTGYGTPYVAAYKKLWGFK